MSTVTIERRAPICVVTIDRPEVRNAVDRPTAQALADAFRAFDADDELLAAVLTGSGGVFCAGADLKAIATGDPERANELQAVDRDDADSGAGGPMGPTRMTLSKPVIAAIEGHAVAGGLELALWCDLRVASRSAVFGVFNRRWGVPLIDGGTIRLARTIGQSRALDMILTGRAVTGEEAYTWGLANYVVEPGLALDEALALAQKIATFPQTSLRTDRSSALTQWGKPLTEALTTEFEGGLVAMQTGERGVGSAGPPTEREVGSAGPPTDVVEGARRFEQGAGRGGAI